MSVSLFLFCAYIYLYYFLDFKVEEEYGYLCKLQKAEKEILPSEPPEGPPPSLYLEGPTLGFGHREL